MKTALNLLAAALLGTTLMAGTALAGTVTLTLYSTGHDTYDGDTVYPYYVKVNGGTPLMMMCDDVATHVSDGSSWTANAYKLTDLSKLKFSSKGLETYEMAAVIFTGVAAGTIDAGDGNAAVWSLFNSTYLDRWSPDLTQINAILTNARNEVRAGGLDYSNFTIYTPTPLGVSQEFLSGYVMQSTPNNPTSPTPEPATYALFGTGLLGLGIAGRKRLAARRLAMAA